MGCVMFVEPIYDPCRGFVQCFQRSGGTLLEFLGSALPWLGLFMLIFVAIGLAALYGDR